MLTKTGKYAGEREVMLGGDVSSHERGGYGRRYTNGHMDEEVAWKGANVTT